MFHCLPKQMYVVYKINRVNNNTKILQINTSVQSANTFKPV